MCKMKKVVLALLLIVSVMISTFGCSQKKVKPFDFSRYYGKDMDVFLKDFDLTVEDFKDGSGGYYDSKETLPFMNYEANYELILDEQKKVGMIVVQFPVSELKEAEKLYQKAQEIEKVYEEMKSAKNYFDSFEGEPYPMREKNSDGGFTTRGSVYSSTSDIRKYPSYDDVKKVMEKEQGEERPREVVGIWNLDHSVQVIISYLEMFDQAGLQIIFGDSEGINAARFGDVEDK